MMWSVFLRKWWIGISLALAVFTLSVGCSTIQGVGQDIQHAGQAIEEVAN